MAIIMDGNGRWAESRRHPRTWGHIRGAKVVSHIVKTASNSSIRSLTLYAFSTENWSRPVGEIRVLFTLLKKYLQKEQKKIIDNNIRFRVMGDTSGISKETTQLIKGLEEASGKASGLNLTFAFGHGGRSDILSSVNRFISQHPGTTMTQDDIEGNLSSSTLGDVDLLIRTGGDWRISNFLLWQMAYAELYFTRTLWPKFSAKEFSEIIELFSKRKRRFGGLSSGMDLKESMREASRQKQLFDSL